MNDSASQIFVSHQDIDRLGGSSGCNQYVNGAKNHVLSEARIVLALVPESRLGMIAHQLESLRSYVGLATHFRVH